MIMQIAASDIEFFSLSNNAIVNWIHNKIPKASNLD